jgi:asparagine N-glycosylation enzyme membrane subunit Stt3
MSSPQLFFVTAVSAPFKRSHFCIFSKKLYHMGITVIILLPVVVVVIIISRLKISGSQKIIWSVLAVLVIFLIIAYLLIQGFERGRDPEMPQEEHEASFKVE